MFDDFRTHCVNTVGEPFMAPGGEMSRYPQHFGENVLRHGSHEWLPYSVDEMRLKSTNTNLSYCRVNPISIFCIYPEGIP